jgi:hypothetical protein
MIIEALAAGVIALAPGSTSTNTDLRPCRDGATITMNYNSPPPCDLDGDNQLNIRLPKWWSNPTKKAFAADSGCRLPKPYRIAVDCDF